MRIKRRREGRAKTGGSRLSELRPEVKDRCLSACKFKAKGNFRQRRPTLNLDAPSSKQASVKSSDIHSSNY